MLGVVWKMGVKTSLMAPFLLFNSRLRIYSPWTRAFFTPAFPGKKRKTTKETKIPTGGGVKENGTTSGHAVRPVLKSDLPKEYREGEPRPDLPWYTLKDVAQHHERTNRVWSTFRQGVYDVTDYVKVHPGKNQRSFRSLPCSLRVFLEWYRLHVGV